MPSSISSSNDRLPTGPHGRMWLVTVAVALLALGAVELGWRSAGHSPSVIDDKNLWSQHRDEAMKPNRLVILGLSRIQLGFAPDVFRERFPNWDVASLVVEGRPPAMTLQHLAADKHFKGTVLVSLNRAAMYKPDAATEDDNWGWFGQQEYVNYYEDTWRPDKAWIRRLATGIQDNVTLVHPNLSLRELVNQSIEGTWPKPFYVDTQPDRSRKAYYAMADLNGRLAFMHSRAIEGMRSPPHDLDVWLESAKQLADWGKAIEARGGTVFFVHMPDKPYGLAKRDPTIKPQFWDRFAAIDGVKSVHFLDEPTLRYKDVANQVPFDCPDYTHLDYADAVIFTGRLLDIMQARGILPK